MAQYKIDFGRIRWEESDVGVRFKAYQQAGKRVRLAEFAREYSEPDWCTKGHIGYVLEGQIEIDFNGKTFVFGPGDGLFIPAGSQHKHKARTLTDKAKIILVEDT